MRLMIIGAGSLGMLFTARLSAVAEQLTLVARSKEQAEALNEQGITLEENARERKINVNVQSISFEEAAGGAQLPETDFALLMVKQPAIDEAMLAFLSGKLSEQTTLVCFQNGIGHQEKLVQAIGKERLILAVTTEAAKKQSPSHVVHTGTGITYIGSTGVSDTVHSENMKKMLAEVLNDAGFETKLSKEMDTRIWSKLIMNAVINPLTAVLRVKNGELLESPWAMRLMRQLYDEAVMVAAAKEIRLPENLWDSLLQVCELTAANHSSMLQDLLQSRRTEIDNMNGSLLQMAEEMGLELPAHQTVYYVVKALE